MDGGGSWSGWGEAKSVAKGSAMLREHTGHNIETHTHFNMTYLCMVELLKHISHIVLNWRGSDRSEAS